MAIIRVEQLYPFPHKAFAAEMKKYPNLTDVVWCQDEPQNQGAWFFVQHYIHENMNEGQKLGYAGRPASASPAVGYAHLHQEQQKALLDQADKSSTRASELAQERFEAGLTDFLGDKRIQGSDAVKHMLANVTAVVLEVVNLVLRLKNPDSIASTGVYISGLVVLILIYSGWKGGALVYRHGIGVSDG